MVKRWQLNNRLDDDQNSSTRAVITKTDPLRGCNDQTNLGWGCNEQNLPCGCNDKLPFTKTDPTGVRISKQRTAGVMRDVEKKKDKRKQLMATLHIV